MISEWGVTLPSLCNRVVKNTRWFISHYDFRMGCDHSPFMEQGGSKNTWWFISDSDFRMGCDPSLFIGTQERKTQKSLFS